MHDSGSWKGDKAGPEDKRRGMRLLPVIPRVQRNTGITKKVLMDRRQTKGQQTMGLEINCGWGKRCKRRV